MFQEENIPELMMELDELEDGTPGSSTKPAWYILILSMLT